MYSVVPTEKAAQEIARAVRLGRELVCPGLFTKLHVHVLSKLLPPSVLSAAVQVCALLSYTLVICVYFIAL